MLEARRAAAVRLRPTRWTRSLRSVTVAVLQLGSLLASSKAAGCRSDRLGRHKPLYEYATLRYRPRYVVHIRDWQRSWMKTDCTGAAMMKSGCARSFLAVALLSATFAVLAAWAGSPNEPTAATSRGFCPAYLTASTVLLRLRLFPLDGPEIDVPVPSGVPRGMNVLAYGPDGRVIYGHRMLSFLQPAGIEEVDFDPPRTRVVPGSVDGALIQIFCLDASLSSGRLTVMGTPWSQPRTFQVDPAAATITQMQADSFSTCGGPGETSIAGWQASARKEGQVSCRH